MPSNPKPKSFDTALKKQSAIVCKTPPSGNVSDWEERMIHSKKSFSRNMALKVMLGYIILWVLGVTLLSDSFLRFFITSPNFIENFMPYKRWVFLLLTAPLLYWIVAKLAFRNQEKNKIVDHVEQKLLRLNRLHYVLSEINHVILRAKDRRILLNEICQTVHKKGGFPLVWIGLGEVKARLPQMIVMASNEKDYLQDVFDDLLVDLSENTHEPSLLCFKNKKTEIINDVGAWGGKKMNWVTRSLKNGFHSIAAFPILTTSGLAGVFAVYSDESDFFMDEEVNLIQGLACEISYVLSDIEKREKTFYSMHHDVVTNLPNRHLLEDRIHQACVGAKHLNIFCAVILIELIDLEELGRQFGKTVSDKILQETSSHLQRLIQERDSLARFSDNGLCILLSHRSQIEEIHQVVNKVMSPFTVNVTARKEISVNLYVGISIFPKDASNSFLLLKNAQLALQEAMVNQDAKSHFYSHQISSNKHYIKNIEFDLQGALERNEFLLYFQPVIDSTSNQIDMMQAQARWRNPKLGELSAIQFIGITEDENWIRVLGEWAIRAACLQLIKWTIEGKTFSLSIDICSKHLRQPNFIKRLETLFREIQFDPKIHSIIFQLNETALLGESESLVNILNQLHEMGVLVAVVNFGTGYASLSFMSKLPVDFYKIDPLFIQALEEDPTFKMIIKGIIAFAYGTGAVVIAEGIDNDKQKQVLNELGCHLIQGNLLSAPVTGKNVSLLFGSGNAW